MYACMLTHECAFVRCFYWVKYIELHCGQQDICF